MKGGNIIQAIKLSFIGDLSINNGYANFVKTEKNPFIDVQSIIKESDFVIGNLEAVVEGKDGENLQKQTRLKVSYQSLELLKDLKVNMYTLANNHIYDQLYDGFIKTVDFLNENNIDHIGANVIPSQETTYIKSIKDKKFAFLNYVHLGTNPNFPPDCKIDVNIYDKHVIVNQIKQVRNHVNFVVLTLHWGMDNSHFPEPWQRKDARDFVKAGANFIVGHHSHVLQGYEKIDNSYVFYSLGNFAFAPLKEGKENDLDRNRQRDSIVLHWLINDDKSEVTWDPIRLDNLFVLPSKRSKIKKLTILIPFVSNSFIWPFYKFYLRYIYKFYYYFFGNGRNPIKQLSKIDKRKLIRAKRIIGLR
ncbi:MAG: CapA family protein [bacterium]